MGSSESFDIIFVFSHPCLAQAAAAAASSPEKQVRWWLSFATSVGEDGNVSSSEDFCYSHGESASYTPAEVISWTCEYFTWR